MRCVCLLVLALPLALSACVDQGRPASCGAPTVALELELSAGRLEPSDPAVCRDQEVTLVVASDVDGVLHIHGYDEQVPATEVSAGGELRLDFVAERSGQFPIELHPAADPTGVEVGILTVHEP
jgi:hypothetical protein